MRDLNLLIVSGSGDFIPLVIRLLNSDSRFMFKYAYFENPHGDERNQEVLSMMGISKNIADLFPYLDTSYGVVTNDPKIYQSFQSYPPFP